MKHGLISFLLLAFINTNSQTIEKFFDFQWKPCEANEARFYCTITKTDSGYLRKDYFIHERHLQMSGKYTDIDCKIANGYFRYYHSNGFLETEGNYVNGKKNGQWLSFHDNGYLSDSINYKDGNKMGTCLSWYKSGYNLDSSVYKEDGSGVQVAWFENGNPSLAGLYVAGRKKNGKWKFYHNNGKPSSVEVYKEDSLIDKKYYNEEGLLETDTTTKDCNAMFPGGIEAWKKFILKKIYFPDRYKIVNADKAVVVVSFSINEEGKVVDVFVSTPFYPEFDKIAKNAITASPKWKPAIEHNRKVKYYLRQAVSFLQEY